MRTAYDALAQRGIPLASNQVHYSLLQRQPETNGVLDTCRELGISLIAYQPLASGALTGKYLDGSRPAGFRRFREPFRGSGFEVLRPVVMVLKMIGDRYGKSPGQVALRWLLEHDNVVPIPGAKNADQATHNAGALSFTLTAEEIAYLNEATEAFRTYSPLRKGQSPGGSMTTVRLSKQVVNCDMNRLGSDVVCDHFAGLNAIGQSGHEAEQSAGDRGERQGDYGRRAEPQQERADREPRRGHRDQCWPCVKFRHDEGADQRRRYQGDDSGECRGGCRPPANSGPIVFSSTVPTASTTIRSHVFMRGLPCLAPRLDDAAPAARSTPPLPQLAPGRLVERRASIPG
jgi:hypothetical protein